MNNDHELQATIISLIEKIDKDLSTGEVEIKSRYFLITQQLSLKLRVPVPIGHKGLPNNILGNLAGKLALQWCKSRYGDKQHSNYQLGYIFVKLRGELWGFAFNLTLGGCKIYINKNIGYKDKQGEVNILSQCKEMTQDLANNLNDRELASIWYTYNLGADAFITLDSWRFFNLEYQDIIYTDFRAAKYHLYHPIPHFGQAKWSYSQAAEKILKGWLRHAGYTANQVREISHKVETLIETFNELYKCEIPIDLANKIFTKGGVRYDEVKVSMNNILEIQLAVFTMITKIGYNPILISS